MKSGNAVRCILVLGMHGSGASALTRMFSLAGAALPRTLLGANEADGTGCWEPERLVRYHDRLLSDLGSSWHDWKPLDFPSLPLSDRKTIHSDIKSILADEFGGRRLWVLKEPRICRFVPIYREVLSDMGVALSPVLIFRNPLEVMASLQRRGDWPVERSAADVCLLWLRHVLDCEAATRGVKRSIASHASIVSDPVAALARIERKAKLDFPNKVDGLGEDIREFLDPASGGHEKGGGEAALEPMLRGWVEDAFSAMRALERNPGSKKARKTLDRVSEAFGASLPVIDAFGTASREALAHKHKLEEEREQIRLDFEGLDRLTEEQKSRIESLDRIAGEQSGQLDAIRRLFDVREGDNRTIDEVIGAHLHSLQAEYDSRLNAQTEGYEGILNSQAADYEEWLAARMEEFAREKNRLTGQVTSLGEDYAKRLDGQAADYEERLAARTEEFAREKNRLTDQIASLAADYEERLAARMEEFAREKNRLTDQMASLGEDYAERLDGQAADYEERLAARTEEFAREKDRLTGEIASLGEDYAERLDGQAADYEERLAARTEEFAREKDRLTDQMASLGDERDAISGEAQYLNAANNDLRAAYDAASLDLRREKTTVLRPIYRNVYGAGGRLMRGVLPESVVHWVKDKVPDPDGARFNGASLDLPYAPTGPARLEDVSPGGGKPDVFVLSIIDWDFRIQRPQHIARALSSNRRVFYVEMMMEREEPAVRKIADNLWAVRLSMDGAGHIQPYSGEPDADRQAAWVRSFFEFCRVVDASPFKQIVVQHPFWWNLVRHLPPEFEIVFDCMDDITGFSNTSRAVIDLENDLLKGCDKLVVSSQYLFDKHREFKAPALIRNGGDINHFSAAAAAGPAPSFLAGSGFEKREGTIDAGYVGAVAEWFDHELIRRTATQNPDIRFHICGDVTVPEPAALDDLDNVHLYGEIAYDDVPAFIRQMDVMTIPFKLLPIIHACDPVKFYEHSAMGKPTVSTRLPELMRAGELIYFAETAEQYGARIRDACAAGALPEYRDKLRLYAAENSWAHRGEEFDAALGRFAKVSVVILAFGDALWTGTTLQSLFDGGDHYPDLEVIVVDNGSDDATLAELRKTCASHPGVRLIENGENLGFARGNNAGLSAAAGEYVVLLNNDTYLAPGAIHAMVRHLRDNPGIGVVGPLTNNIGNEARLDVHYADMAEMIDVARSVTTGYRGVYSPVRVSAYFAAMFRTADLETFGLLPEEYGRGMFEDDDHCETIRKHGFICALAEDAFVHHHLSGTFSTIGGDEKRRLFERNREIFEAKWGAWIPHEYRSDRPVGSLSNDNLKPTADIAPFRRFSRLPQGPTP